MTDIRNPYAAPAGNVIAAEPPPRVGNTRLRSSPAVVPARAGTRWISEAWALYKKAWGTLLLTMLVYFGVAMVAGLIPVAGDLFMSVAMGCWLFGWALMYRKLAEGEAVAVGDLFAGFTHATRGKILMVGLNYLLMLFAILAVLAVIVVAIVGTHVFQLASAEEFNRFFQLYLPAFLAAVVLFLAGVFLAYAAIFYAPLLVAFHDMPVGEAMRMSFSGCLRNWRAMTLMSLAIMGLMIASVVTLFIGLIVLVPVLMGIGYVSYRQIFLEQG